MSNRPTTIVLNHLDYIEEKDRKEFIENIEKGINQKINYIGLDDKCIIKM